LSSAAASVALARISPPYLMVGQSGGGFDAYHYAGRYPGEVAGLVLLDVPAGQAHMSAADMAELAWEARATLTRMHRDLGWVSVP